jgi:hypothetical protein
MNQVEIAPQVEHEVTLARDASSRFDQILQRHELLILFVLVLYAAIRILFFSAAFPLFNSTDEQIHFDSVYKFSHGYVPHKGLPLVSPECARIFTLYESPEYLTEPAVLRAAHLDQPIATLPPDMRAMKFQRFYTYWSSKRNFEIDSPPLYYLIAAVWLKAGSAFGLTDWKLAYWLRFLNVVPYAALSFLAYRLVKEIYPRRQGLSLFVPALIAVFPQDIFYGINREVFSAPFAALSLLLLALSLRRLAKARMYLLAGAFAVGLTFLIDVSNAVLYLALFAALVFWLNRGYRERSFRSDAIVAGAAGLSAITLPALWLARNYLYVGDITGSRDKIAALGWTLKPWADRWQHPLFSWQGTGYFFRELMKTYWRGEFLWHGKPLASSFLDWFFVLTTYGLIVAFVVYFLIQRRSSKDVQWWCDFVAVSLVAGAFLFLAVLSLPFDFGTCFYPSRAHPYFVSGRIISGTVLPFFIVFASAFEMLVSLIRKWVRPSIAMAAMVLFIGASDILLKGSVVHSSFNLFSLLQ